MPGTYLHRLSPAVCAELLQLGTQRSIPAGTQIIRQGEHRSDVFLLRAAGAKGPACVKVSILLPEGTSALLAIRMTGDVVGEGAGFRSEGTRGATVTTCATISVQSIARDKFDAFLAERPEASLALCALLTERQDFANRRRLDYTAFDVRIRLARLIFELLLGHGVPAEVGGRELGFSLSQEELGKLVGAGLDAANKAMRRLKAEGLIQMRRQGFAARNMEALRVAAQLD